jgi:tetratricopeptide (TPR) repeat protein
MAAHKPNIDDIYFAALEKADVGERSAYLSEACGDDSELRSRVERLLSVQSRVASFLESPPPGISAGATVAQLPLEQPGTQIGPYKLLQEIGHGGMGVVYMAEQIEPVRRKVALKIIKPGMDTRQVIARFEAERQALSLMDHPNIAKVLDAGATDSGRPYFVMELVKGQPITEYCDEKHLTPRERLELLLPVCQAIQHAHQKGIIHRDIKPSNILVAEYDEKPVPKVIDFGVAKAISQPLTEKTMFTGLGQIVGTLEYMSPEQAKVNQLDIDTRSDIYSLGVLMYELLTGSTPFDRERLRSAAWDEMLRIIREEEPPRPSTKLSSSETLASVSANRSMEPTRLSRTVRGELDWIVMKALEKDRNRRYETANGLAMDIQRYLADEPVLACPPSLGYRLRKFSRRNKAALSVASVVLLSLMLLGTGIGWAMRDRAERQSRVATQVEVILSDVDELQNEQKWPEALAAARRAEAAVKGGEADPETTERVDSLLKDLELIDRLEQIRMKQSAWIGSSFDYTGTDREYVRVFRDYGVDVDELAIEVSIERFNARPEICIPVAAALDQWISVRRNLEAGSVSERLRAIASAIDPDRLRNRLRATWGQPATAVADELRQLAESIDFRAQHPITLVGLAETLNRAKQSEAAMRLLRNARAVHPGDFWLNFNLAHALAQDYDDDGAVRFYTAAEAIRPKAVAAINNLGNALRDQMKLKEAVDCYRRAIEIDPKFAFGYQNLGITLSKQGKWDEAIAACRKAIDLDQRDASAYMNLGIVLKDQKKLTDAIAAHRRAVELEPAFALAYSHLGAALRDQGQLDDATAAHRKAIELDPDAAYNYYDLGLDLSAQGKPDDAIAAFRKAVELNPKHSVAFGELGVVLSKQDKLPEAETAFLAAIKLNPMDAVSNCNLGNIYAVQGKADEAIAAYRKAIEADPRGVTAYHNLAAALARGKNHEEAIAVYRSAINVDPKNVQAYIELGKQLNDHSNDYAEAIDCFQQAIVLEPENARAYRHLAATFVKQELLIEAVAALTKATEFEPKQKENWDQRAHVFVALGQWDRAAADFNRCTELDSDSHSAWRWAAYAYLASGDSENYQRACRELLVRFGQTDDPTTAERTAKICALAPGAVADFAAVERLAQFAVTGTEKRNSYTWFAFAKGLTEYRAGRHEEALKWMKLYRPKPDGGQGSAMTFAAMAMAKQRLGRNDEAQESLAKARAILAQKQPDPAKGRPYGNSWHEWLDAQILSREAEKVLLSRSDEEPATVHETPD